MIKQILKVNEETALLIGAKKSEIEKAKKRYGFIKNIEVKYVNDGTVPIYLEN